MTEHRRQSLKRSWDILVAKRRKAGLCRCGEKLASGYRTCSHCRSLQRKRWNHYADSRRQSGQCAHCGRPRKSGAKCGYCNANKIKSKAKLKKQVFDAYGNKCACCGEKEKAFLTIDHIHGGGNAHRKQLNGNFYRWLRRRGFPKDDFEMLCFNCNLGRRINGGVCPHKA